jgi:hypothetical protein
MPIQHSTKAARTLIHFPIIHTEVDMGSLAVSLQQAKAAQMGNRKLARAIAAIEKRWDEIEDAVEALAVVPGKTKIYQDALPVCGCEAVIVAELAAAGSRNHQILVRLQERGAELMGTESAALLVTEYRSVLTAAPAASGRAPRPADAPEVSAKALLQQRDCFIADRINRTLPEGGTGILFLGVLHSFRSYLDPDIEVVRPLPSHHLPRVR